MIIDNNLPVTKKVCRLCCSKGLHLIIDGGKQAFSNRFLVSEIEKEDHHLMAFGLCMNCGLVQLIEPAPAHEIRPRFDWITYNEPEEHLDALTDTLLSVADIRNSTIVGAISYKDTSLLERLQKKGVKKSWAILPEQHLGVKGKNIGVETIQERLSAEGTISVLENLAKADVLLVRHILEHSHDLASFFSVLKKLTKPDGYMVLEVPCCDNQMEDYDYTMLWEEHVSYFTPATFKKCMEEMGFSLIHYERVQYPLEDVLIGIVKISFDKSDEKTKSDYDPDIEIRRAKNYGVKFPEFGITINNYLSEFGRKEGNIAILGAGHMACSYLNLLGITRHIDCLLDDNPNKTGLFMPGSKLPIYSPDFLMQNNIKMCLLAVNPVLDEKIIRKFKMFSENNGVFYSVFPGSEYALNNLKPIKNTIE